LKRSGHVADKEGRSERKRYVYFELGSVAWENVNYTSLLYFIFSNIYFIEWGKRYRKSILKCYYLCG
jgi:hypothetical protein